MTGVLDILAAELGQNDKADISYGPLMYRDFLSKVGWGEIEGFYFSKGYMPKSDIFDDETASLIPDDFHIFGDDMAGAVFGFREAEPGVFMIDSVSPDEIGKISDSFEAFLRKWFIAHKD